MLDFSQHNLPTALKLFKLRLTAPAPEGGEGRATFGIDIYDCAPRFIVYPGFPQGHKFNKIEAESDYVSMRAILDALIDVADNKLPGVEIECKNYVFSRGEGGKNKRSDTPVTKAKVRIGRGDRGIFIAAIHWNKEAPQIPFYYDSGDWHHWLDKDGVAIPKLEMSERYARAWARNMIDLLAILEQETFIPAKDIKARKEATKGQGGGGWSGSRQGGSSWQKPATAPQAAPAATESFDSDIPW